jgi:16S rRNA (cytosine1402-N4)-methyltransferase
MTGDAPQAAPEAPHIPVLLDEVLEALAVKPGETHVDGTFGAGGYTRAILAAGAARVFAFDRDPDAIAAGRALEAASEGRLILVPERFSRMVEALKARGVETVDGVTLDIGVSSMQLDQADRGFSFQGDGPLDMRMSQEGQSAADFVNEADEAEIADVLHLYGEEPRARRIARAIVAARPLSRTGELAEVVRRAVGHHPGMPKDPATRTFQAIRIHLNRELDELDEAMAGAEQLLSEGGRLAIVSFHSLEDRMVKRFLAARGKPAPAGSRHRPAAGEARPSSFDSVSRGIRAGENETRRNPRARSATLRAAHRTAAAAWPREQSAPAIATTAKTARRGART